jgi:hypothetical protein
VEPPLLKEAPGVLVNLVSATRWAIGALVRVGGVRLLAKLGQGGLLYGGAAPPAPVAEHAAFLYRPQSTEAAIAETRALPEIIRQMNEAARPQAWGDWPVTIVAAYRGAAPEPALLAGLEELAQLSSRGKVVTVQGSHFVHFEHPDTVADAIMEIAQGASWSQPSSN